MNDKQLMPYPSLALLTDLYQLTMAYGYWKTGVAQKEAVFHLFFRENPFQGGFAMACGLSYAMDFIENFHFDPTDIDYLASLRGSDQKPLFEKAFLSSLKEMKFQCDVDAMPEGTVVFAFEPLIRVQGPLLQCQLLETILLNILNFQTLIATKAARVCLAAKGDSVLEFGLRRAQGMAGAVAASRAAYIGGCHATSNVLAGKMFGIPVKGTQAHSWIMSFDDELEAFQAYAKALPNNCIFLVDTYDTLQGVKKAVEVGKWLRQQGHEMLGVRLDSGDLASLSVAARKILDEAGFTKAKIIGSNELDEYAIEDLKNRGAKIDIWGVGTKLMTAYDQPALGGVYKLTAVRTTDEEWKYKIKLSEQAIKVSNPGIQQVRRFSAEGMALADMIYDVRTSLTGDCPTGLSPRGLQKSLSRSFGMKINKGDYEIIDLQEENKQTKILAGTAFTDLLVPVFRRGKQVYTPPPTVHDIRQYAQTNLARFKPELKRLANPVRHPVGLEKSLSLLKTDLIRRTKEPTP